jgi:hypothetical protein
MVGRIRFGSPGPSSPVVWLTRPWTRRALVVLDAHRLSCDEAWRGAQRAFACGGVARRADSVLREPHVVPALARERFEDGLLIIVTQCHLFLLRAGRATAPLRAGLPTWRTPTGEFTIAEPHR